MVKAPEAITEDNFLQKRWARYLFVLSSFLGAVLLLLVLNISLGSVHIPFLDVCGIFLGKKAGSEVFGSVIWKIRLPRALAASLSGSALAAGGMLLQIFFRNPIVGPYVLGISSGATVMVALVMLGGFSLGMTSLHPIFLSLAALLGALGAMMAVMAAAVKVRDIVSLLVIGLMVGYVASALSHFLIAFAEKERVHRFVLWTLGSFSGFRWQEVEILAIAIPILLLFSFFLSKPLNALLLGEDYARSMGVRIKPFRYLIIFLSSALAALVTAFAGPVAFIGLAVPHMARLSLGTSDSRVLLPGTILLGAAVTSLCDLLARTAFSPVELPISATTSLFGAPIVIFLLLRRRAAV